MIYLISRVFFALDFFNFLAHCIWSWSRVSNILSSIVILKLVQNFRHFTQRQKLMVFEIFTSLRRLLLWATPFKQILKKLMANIYTLPKLHFIIWFQHTALIRNMRFVLDEKLPQNASKFAILLEYENPCSFFHFSFRATLFFS